MFFEKVQQGYATFFVWTHTRKGLETQPFMTTVLLFMQSVFSTYKTRLDCGCKPSKSTWQHVSHFFSRVTSKGALRSSGLCSQSNTIAPLSVLVTCQQMYDKIILACHQENRLNISEVTTAMQCEKLQII